MFFRWDMILHSFFFQMNWFICSNTRNNHALGSWHYLPSLIIMPSVWVDICRTPIPHQQTNTQTDDNLNFCMVFHHFWSFHFLHSTPVIWFRTLCSIGWCIASLTRVPRGGGRICPLPADALLLSEEDFNNQINSSSASVWNRSNAV